MEKKNRVITVERRQRSNLKHKIPDPIFCIYMSWIQWTLSQVKIFNHRFNLATFSSNIWSKLKSPTIKILSCVGSSLIKQMKSSVKVPKGPGIRYSINNKNVSFSISTTIGNALKTLGITITSIMFTLLTL